MYVRKPIKYSTEVSNMKSKILSAILSIAMVIASTTNVVFADATVLTSIGGELSNGDYILNEDITLATNITINGTVSIDLNGHVLKGTGTGSVIKVNNVGNLTIQDGNPSNTHTGDFASLPAGGCITGGKGTKVSSEFLGGGVYVENGGAFTMNGGTIVGCDATKGGGVFTWDNFTMNNSSAIVNCTATNDGGGVYVYSGTFTMNDGTIDRNTANVSGGGVYVWTNGNFAMTDGTISNNKANSTNNGYAGGGVCICGEFSMSDGTITSNEANTVGGGVNIANGNFTMTGGTITNNTAEAGGGVDVAENGEFILKEGTISDNTAKNNGGGVIARGKFDMQGGTIKYNKVTTDNNVWGGGGVAIYLDGKATLSGGTIQYNSSNTQGGGLIILYNHNSRQEVTISGVSIIENTAKNNGGGVYVTSDGLTPIVVGADTKIINNVTGGEIVNGTLSGGTTNNFYLLSNTNKKYIELGTGDNVPKQGMLVGITMETVPLVGNPIKITTNGTASDVQHFFPDNENYKISFNAGTDATGDEYLELKVITIADILETVEGGFPTTSESGWVNGNGAKVRIEDGCIAFASKTDLNSVLTKDDNNNYKFGNNYTFVMDSGVLSSIKVEEAIFFPPTKDPNGVYVPYKYTNDPISIPAGYTDGITFTTNGKYADQASTPVTVSIDDESLVYGEDYEVTAGSTDTVSFTNVIIKGSYVSRLTVGTHTIKTGMGGYVDISTQFTITSPEPTPSYKVPNTGVEGTANNNSLLKLSSLSLLAIGTYLVIKKKER